MSKAQKKKLKQSNSTKKNIKQDSYKWLPFIGKRCPHCGSTNIEYETKLILTVFPPQVNCRCLECKQTFLSDQLKNLDDEIIISTNIESEEVVEDIEEQNETMNENADICDSTNEFSNEISETFDLANPNNVDVEELETLEKPVCNKKDILYGWICPICNKINSPYKESCDCMNISSIEESKTISTQENEEVITCDKSKQEKVTNIDKGFELNYDIDKIKCI